MGTDATRARLATGVPGFDELLGGGLPEGQTLVVTGDPGAGKTVLCSQIAFAHAREGRSVLFATITSESQDKLLLDLGGFSFFSREPIGERLFFLSLYPALKKGPKEARDLIVKTVIERRAKLLVLDGFRAVRDLWRDEAKMREFLYELGVGVSAAGCSCLITTEYGLPRLLEFPEATTVDGIISLTREAAGATSHRRVEIVKLRGQRHHTGRHTLRLNDDGVSMVPRLEAVPRQDRDYEAAAERVSFARPELDALLRGGLQLGSTTLLAGSTGVGKTLLALQFLAEGAARGEKGVFYAFTEPPRSLIRRADGIGLRMSTHVQSGLVRIEYPPPVEADGDELAQDIIAKAKEFGARRLVVDDLLELEEAVSPPGRLRAFFTALMVRLRSLGATSIFTKQISKLVGVELDFTDTPIASVAENLLFLRHVELAGKLHRVLSILNLRDSAFDADLREFVITDEGIRVLGPMQGAHGLLTGLARPLRSRSTDGDR